MGLGQGSQTGCSCVCGTGVAPIQWGMGGYFWYDWCDNSLPRPVLDDSLTVMIESSSQNQQLHTYTSKWTICNCITHYPCLRQRGYQMHVSEREVCWCLGGFNIKSDWREWTVVENAGKTEECISLFHNLSATTDTWTNSCKISGCWLFSLVGDDKVALVRSQLLTTDFLFEHACK